MRSALCLLGLVLAVNPASAAVKTDVVTMANGDRVTCEIKKLDRGLLEASTDSWGTLQIEWTEVDHVTSRSRFEVHLRSGQRLVGTLQAASARGHVAIDDGAPQAYAIADIVFMKPVGASFWRQLDGSMDAGYSFASAGLATQWSLSADVIRRREDTDTRLAGDSFFSSKEGAEDSSRHSVSLEVTRRVSRRWGVVIMGEAQSNDELQLRLRAQAGGGLTHNVFQSNQRLLIGFGGLMYSRELFTDETPATDSVEAFIGSQFEWFVFNTPKTRLTNNVTVFPNVTTPGRVRVELDTSVQRELVKDFFVNVSFVDSYDNRPPSAAATSNDLTLVTSIGWSF